MENTEKTAEILNDLVQINNDRIEGYEKAIENLKDEDQDLKSLFSSMIDESRNYRVALSNEINVFGVDTDDDTTASGKLYRAWMDVKAVFTGHDRKSVLENCEFGEDAAQTAYKTALSDETLPLYLKDFILDQKQQLKESHDQVKNLRDQYHS